MGSPETFELQKMPLANAIRFARFAYVEPEFDAVFAFSLAYNSLFCLPKPFVLLSQRSNEVEKNKLSRASDVDAL